MYRRLLCTICIFLSVLSSVRAQSPALQAVEYERLVFEGAPAGQVNDALIGRARCLIELQRWEEASASLERLRMFAVPASMIGEVAYLKMLCLYRQGKYNDALTIALEAALPDTPEVLRLKALVYAGVRDYESSYALALKVSASPEQLKKLYRKAPKEKIVTAAMFLAIIPTAGNLYVHRTDRWWVSLASASSAALTVWQALEGNWISAILGGALLADTFYIDRNLRTTPAFALEYNEKSLKIFLEELEKLLL